MRALPALDARSCIVREAPTSDLRVCAEVSIDKEYEAHGCIKQQPCAILLIEPAPEASQEAGSLCSVGFKGGYSASIHFTV